MAQLDPTCDRLLSTIRAVDKRLGVRPSRPMTEPQVADLLDIPFDLVQQACLSPLAYTIGTDFKPAGRPEADTIIHWDGW